MEEDTLSGRKEDTLSGVKEDHTQGRLQQRRRLHKEEGPQQEGHIHPLQLVLVEAVETSVNHCLRTWSSL